MATRALLACAMSVALSTNLGCCCLEEFFACHNDYGYGDCGGCGSCGDCTSGYAHAARPVDDCCDVCHGCHDGHFWAPGCRLCNLHTWDFLGWWAGCGAHGGCGEVYRGDYASDPPACCEPCDHYGNWVGHHHGYRAPYRTGPYDDYHASYRAPYRGAPSVMVQEESTSESTPVVAEAEQPEKVATTRVIPKSRVVPEPVRRKATWRARRASASISQGPAMQQQWRSTGTQR